MCLGQLFAIKLINASVTHLSNVNHLLIDEKENILEMTMPHEVDCYVEFMSQSWDFLIEVLLKSQKQLLSTSLVG